jgi:hypothetical protein
MLFKVHRLCNVKQHMMVTVNGTLEKTEVEL